MKKNREKGAAPDAIKTAVQAILDHLRLVLTCPSDLQHVEAFLEIISTASDEMRQQILDLMRSRFGRSSEKKSRKQVGELLRNGGVGIPDEVAEKHQRAHEEAEAAKKDNAKPEKEKIRKRPNRSGRNSSIPTDFPRQEQVIDVSAAEKQCCGCGRLKIVIGCDTTEQLHYIPSQLNILRTVYPKYACGRCKDHKVSTAPRQTRPTMGEGLATFALLAYIIVSKFVDHLPLYRLHRMFARQGLPLPESTMGQWVANCGDALEPIARLIGQQALAAHVLQTDDTGLRVLDKDHHSGTKRGHLWGYLGDGKWFYYRYTPDWRAADTQNFLAGRKGWLVADCYAGYDVLFSGPGATCIEVACWSHTRRYFEKAIGQDKQAAVGIHYIGELYAIEKKARDNNLDAAATRQLRQKEAVPIIDNFQAWVKDRIGWITPKSALGKALTYASNHQDALRRYVDDGALPIDNTAVERAHRATAVGRKNWLFAGSDAAAERAAVLYTTVVTCALNNVNPSTYIADVLMRIQQRGSASNINALLPVNWAADQKMKQDAAA